MKRFWRAVKTWLYVRMILPIGEAPANAKDRWTDWLDEHAPKDKQ